MPDKKPQIDADARGFVLFRRSAFIRADLRPASQCAKNLPVSIPDQPAGGCPQGFTLVAANRNLLDPQC
jgi:hypothetical protein